MLCADIMMIQATSLIDGKLDDLFGAWSESNCTKDDAISPANYKFNGATNLVQFDTEITQYFCGDTFSFSYKAEQEMFGADVIMLEALRFFLSETQDLPGPLCELSNLSLSLISGHPSFVCIAQVKCTSLYNNIFQHRSLSFRVKAGVQRAASP